MAAGCRYAEEKWSKNERALSQGCDFERAWSVVFLKGGGLSPTNLCRNEAITSDHRRRAPGLMAGRSERFLGGSLDVLSPTGAVWEDSNGEAAAEAPPDVGSVCKRYRSELADFFATFFFTAT